VQIIEMLWEVAYADGVLDAQEDMLLRRIAGLIYVSDGERGRRARTRLRSWRRRRERTAGRRAVERVGLNDGRFARRTPSRPNASIRRWAIWCVWDAPACSASV
jgi:hypothetical protein